MTEQRHAALDIHADRRRGGDAGELRSAPDRAPHPHRRVVVLLLLALGAGRTIMSRMANAARSKRAPPSSDAVREDALAKSERQPARRWRCRARCRASCSRRSRRAPAAT